MDRIIAFLVIVASLGLTVSGTVVTCYYGSWAVWRPGIGRFDVEDIDPHLCTHVIFGFAGLSNYTWEIEVLDPWNELCDDGGRCAFDRFTALKEQNQALKTILAVGGWNEGSEDYSIMASNSYKRKKFITSTIHLIRQHNFDGVDIDWEYPGLRGGCPHDKENFIKLLDEFRVELDKHNLLMTAAVAGGKPTIDAAYDVEGLVRNMDFLHIMTYDFHGAWENHTHHNAPLKGYFADEGDMIYFNVAFAAQYWIDLGAPKEKLVLGLATYGRCFTLDDFEEHGMLAPASLPGHKGPYTRIPGTMGYNEICEYQGMQDWKVVHDPNLCEPYTYYQGTKIWCGYDDPESTFIKARFAKNLGYAGFMVWTIDTDDFQPMCHDRRFNMINTMKEAFNLPADPPGTEDYCTYPGFMSTTSAEPPSTTTTPTTTTPTTTTPTTTIPTTTTTPITTPTISTGIPVYPVKPDCSNSTQMFYPHEDCSRYWRCVDGMAILEMCAPGTLFDPVLLICNWESGVDTSHCRLWDCEIENTYYPGKMCNEYIWCVGGQPTLNTCSGGLYWNQQIHNCVNPDQTDTSNCIKP